MSFEPTSRDLSAVIRSMFIHVGRGRPRERTYYPLHEDARRTKAQVRQLPPTLSTYIHTYIQSTRDTAFFLVLSLFQTPPPPRRSCLIKTIGISSTSLELLYDAHQVCAPYARLPYGTWSQATRNLVPFTLTPASGPRGSPDVRQEKPSSNSREWNLLLVAPVIPHVLPETHIVLVFLST